MTISTTTTRSEYVGNGVTVDFDFTFKVTAAGDVTVFFDDAEQFSGFSTAANADQDASPGGTVTFLASPGDGVLVSLRRQVSLTQETSLSPYSPFPAKSVERALDAIVMQVQQLEGGVAAAGYANTDYVDAAVASALGGVPPASETTLKVAAQEHLAAPLSVIGAMQAKTLGLRAILRNRRLWADGSEYFTPGGYSGYYLRDFYHSAVAYPGYFTSSKLRTAVNFWASSYNPSTHVVGFSTSNGSSFGYNIAGSSGPAVFDSAPYFALLVALCVERGDTTVWAAHGATALAVLAASPTQSNLVYSNPSGYTIGWGFHDRVNLTGGLAMATALHAYAYRRLSVLVDATLATQAAALELGLRALRRSDGYYHASSDHQYADVVATALIAGNGLCTAAEALESGARLAADHRAGTISWHGGLRWLPSPDLWPVGICATTVNTYQNGGYWLGEWCWWAAKAMLAAGRGAEAQDLLGGMVAEILRMHRVNANGPFEWHGPAGQGQGMYGAAAAGLVGVASPEPTDIIINLPGAASSSAVVAVPPCAAEEVEVFAAVTPATATTIQLQAGGYLSGGYSDPFYGVSSAVQAAIVLLGTATYRLVSKGLAHAFPWGGFLKANILGGSATQPFVVKVSQRRVRNPSLVNQTLAAWSDAFGADTVASYETNSPYWTVTGGRLYQTFGMQDDGFRAPVFFKDGTVEAMVMTVNGASVFPGLVARWVDARNFIYLQLSGSGATVYDVVNGVSTSIGTVAVSTTNNVPIFARLTLSGTTVVARVNSTDSAVLTTTVVAKGRAGGGWRGSVLGTANTASWDDLVVTPLADTQRDMVSDGLTPYTRTGTWTVSASRLRSTDTAAPVIAVHADPTPAADCGVDGIFTSADWAAKPAGLCVRCVSSAQSIFAICNGTTVSVYDRFASANTLIGTATLAAAVSNGDDLTMSLRVVGGRITVKAGSEYFHFQTVRAAAAGTAGAYCQNAGSSAAEISYSKLYVTVYPSNLRPLPVGTVLDGGPIYSAWVTDDSYRGAIGASVVLRDETGAALSTVADANDAWAAY